MFALGAAKYYTKIIKSFQSFQISPLIRCYKKLIGQCGGGGKEGEELFVEMRRKCLAYCRNQITTFSHRVFSSFGRAILICGWVCGMKKPVVSE